AAAALRTLLAAAPNDRNAGAWATALDACRENRAVAVYNLAVDAVNTARFDEARARLRGICPGEDRWAPLCESLTRRIDSWERSFRSTLAARQTALAAQPGSAADLLALAELHAAVGRYGEAAAYYDRLSRIDSDIPGLADRVAEVSPRNAPDFEKAVPVDGGTVTLTLPSEALAADLQSATRAAWLRVRTALGADAVGGSLAIRVYGSRRSFRENAGYRVGALVKGYYRLGRVNVFATPSHTLVEWVSVLTHETAHHAIERLSRGRCARWLSEGIARYVEGDSAVVDRARLRARLDAGSIPPAAGLDDLIDRSWNDPEAVIDSRDAGLLAAEEMARRGGLIRLREILLALGDGAPLEEALRRLAGGDLDAIDRAWRERLRRSES
ncbi:MAG TPA: hypothetical protein VFP98_03890, partial [Candidatus Polarisedimenticolia bacterium]|nr:hypothetical protein [Candidatus Polarisedimenticolia bacterium]